SAMVELWHGWREPLELIGCHPFPRKGWSAAELCITYAKHTSATGGGRSTSFASLRRFCAIAANVKSKLAPHGPRKRRRLSRKIRLRRSNKHLNTFAIPARPVSGDSAQRHFWTTLRLEEAAAAVACLGSYIEKRIPIIDQLPRRGENLAGR